MSVRSGLRPDLERSGRMRITSAVSISTSEPGPISIPISRRLAALGARLTLLGRDSGRLEALDLDATLVTGDLSSIAFD